MSTRGTGWEALEVRISHTQSERDTISLLETVHTLQTTSEMEPVLRMPERRVESISCSQRIYQGDFDDFWSKNVFVFHGESICVVVYLPNGMHHRELETFGVFGGKVTLIPLQLGGRGTDELLVRARWRNTLVLQTSQQRRT